MASWGHYLVLLLVCFSIINLVLIEIVKKQLNTDSFLIIGEAISGISFIFIFFYNSYFYNSYKILKNLYPLEV